jgi:hypothetical protein
VSVMHQGRHAWIITIDRKEHLCKPSICIMGHGVIGGHACNMTSGHAELQGQTSLVIMLNHLHCIYTASPKYLQYFTAITRETYRDVKMKQSIIYGITDKQAWINIWNFGHKEKPQTFNRNG